MVRAIDNIVTDAPLRDIRLSIGPAEALLRGPDDVSGLELQEEVQEQFSESSPVNEEELNERERQGYERGREESVAQYEAQIQTLRAELDQKNSNELPEMLGKIESQVSGELNQRLNELETELVEFATEAAIRLVNGLPISTKIVEAAIQDALGHCENDTEVSVHLNPEDLKLLKEAGSDLMSDSPHQRRVRYMKDEEVSRGGCLVETSYGLIDGRRETRERLLREAVDA
ncbi:MAG: FliH/SctL family protein [Verrucomicrobiota bacterium]|nr:FliH/SctL family protein [Verrucomicrobiota bacterium]